MGNAIGRRDEHQLFVPSVGSKLFSEAEARDGFSALVLNYTPRQLSKMSGTTPEGARHWVDGSRGPNLASAINVARCIPAVAQWIAENIGHTREAKAMSRDAIAKALYALAATEGPDALWARKMVALMTQPTERDEQKSAPRDTQTIDFVEQLQQRRGFR